MEKENNGRSTTMMTNTMKWNVFRMSRWTYSVWDVGVTQSVLRKKWCLLTEWRDIWRVTETECIQSIEADIFCLRHWPIEVSPDTPDLCKHHHFCTIKFTAPISPHFLIPLVKRLLLGSQTKLQEWFLFASKLTKLRILVWMNSATLYKN